MAFDSFSVGSEIPKRELWTWDTLRASAGVGVGGEDENTKGLDWGHNDWSFLMPLQPQPLSTSRQVTSNLLLGCFECCENKAQVRGEDKEVEEEHGDSQGSKTFALIDPIHLLTPGPLQQLESSQSWPRSPQPLLYAVDSLSLLQPQSDHNVPLLQSALQKAAFLSE